MIWISCLHALLNGDGVGRANVVATKDCARQWLSAMIDVGMVLKEILCSVCDKYEERYSSDEESGGDGGGDGWFLSLSK